jgi:hypothetical protein
VVVARSRGSGDIAGVCQRDVAARAALFLAIVQFRGRAPTASDIAARGWYRMIGESVGPSFALRAEMRYNADVAGRQGENFACNSSG